MTTPILTQGSNSYVTLADADAYFAGRFGAADWDNATPDDKAKALITAAKALDRQFYKGAKKDQTQIMQFPRRYNRKLHDIWQRWLQNNVQEAGSEWGGSEWGVLYFEGSTWAVESEIPDRVKEAQMEEALAILVHYGPEAQRLMLQRRGVTQFSIGGRVGLSEQYAPGAGRGLLSQEAKELLQPYKAGAVAIV